MSSQPLPSHCLFFHHVLGSRGEENSPRWDHILTGRLAGERRGPWGLQLLSGLLHVGCLRKPPRFLHRTLRGHLILASTSCPRNLTTFFFSTPLITVELCRALEQRLRWRTTTNDALKIWGGSLT